LVPFHFSSTCFKRPKQRKLHTHMYIKFQLKEKICNWLIKIDLAKTQHTHIKSKKEKEKKC
jgi:hypothetical protein